MRKSIWHDPADFMFDLYEEEKNELVANLAQKIAEFENRISTHGKAIQSLFSAIRKLMIPPESDHRRIGFDLDK